MSVPAIIVPGGMSTACLQRIDVLDVERFAWTTAKLRVQTQLSLTSSTSLDIASYLD